MVDTGNVEWDVVQLGRSSVKNLMKKGDYFEKIDYDLVDTANIDPSVPLRVFAGHAGLVGGDGLPDGCLQWRGTRRLGGLLGHKEVSGRSRSGWCRSEFARVGIRAHGRRCAAG